MMAYVGAKKKSGQPVHKKGDLTLLHFQAKYGSIGPTNEDFGRSLRKPKDHSGAF